ncbi:hypothetical protein KC887_07495 [Candidatus Kaiserbacteria bacterium]|nr:hypothetical protein [Candidatus Kaiserbacteria bacterium]
MPKRMTFNYGMTGKVTQEIWTETEMAEALGISVSDVHWRCWPSDDPRGWPTDGITLSFHVKRHGKYLFNAEAYNANLHKYGNG